MIKVLFFNNIYWIIQYIWFWLINAATIFAISLKITPTIFITIQYRIIDDILMSKLLKRLQRFNMIYLCGAHYIDTVYLSHGRELW